MPVYVDNFRSQFGRMTMVHMVADSTQELLAMADKIGVARKWIQHAGTPKEHFDVCLTKRKLAVENGAREITCEEFVEIWNRKRAQAEQYEERAAIKEFDGKMSREQAEKEARQEIYGQ